MKGETHAAVGMAVGAAVAYHAGLPFPESALVVITGGIGGLLPDIDHPRSRISQAFAPVHWLLIGIKHRGITHSALAVAQITLLVTLLPIPQSLGLSLIGGYISHLVTDAMTSSGIPLLFPWKRDFSLYGKRWAVRGGWRESLLYIGAMVVVLIVVLKSGVQLT